MAYIRSKAFEVSQIGMEAAGAFGTKVASTRRLNGTDIKLKVMSENSQQKPAGSRFPTVGIQNREWTEGSANSDVAQYTDFSYIKANAFGTPDITTPGGGTNSRELLWDIPSFTQLSPRPWTVEGGQAAYAHRAGYVLVKTLGKEYKRNGVKTSADMFGQKLETGVTLTAGTNELQTLSKTGTVSSGTFTLTFRGETTAAIAFGATAGTIQTALLLLSNLDTGDVTVGGGPAGTTDVTFTFGGIYASTNVPLIVVNSGSLVGGGSYNIVQTTAGAALTQGALKPISGDDWNLYVDTAASGLGGTKLTHCYEASWKISDLYGPEWPANTSNPSWNTHVDLVPGTDFKFKVQADSTGMGYLANVQSGDLIFARLEATGPIIEGALPYLSREDFAVILTSIGDFGDVDGVYAVEYTGVIAHDATWGKAASFLDRNTFTAIS